jgi:hypothetical protein
MGGGRTRTRFLQLFQHFIMLPADLSPFCELVLGTGCVHFEPQFEELLLQDFLLGYGFGGRCWEAVVEVP